MNLYEFNGNNPAMFTDPLGLSPDDCKKVKCPSISVVQNDPTVRAAGEDMLRASMKDNAERGAYLFNGPKGTIVVGEVKVGKSGAGEVDLGSALDDAIGSIHTHQPIQGANGLTFPGGQPSGPDASNVRARNIHGVVEETDKRHFNRMTRAVITTRWSASRPSNPKAENTMLRSAPTWCTTGLLAFVVGCRSAERQPAGTVMPACAGVQSIVRRATGSIPQDRACAYVRDAIQLLAAASAAEAGLAPADTSRISSATVDAIAQIDSAGTPLAAWWLVTLHLDGRSYDAEVRFNQQSGERSMRPVHK